MCAQDQPLPVPSSSKDPTHQRNKTPPSASPTPSLGDCASPQVEASQSSTRACSPSHLERAGAPGAPLLRLRLRAPRDGPCRPRARCGPRPSGPPGGGARTWRAATGVGSGCGGGVRSIWLRGSAGARRASGLWQEERIKPRWQLREGDG